MLFKENITMDFLNEDLEKTLNGIIEFGYCSISFSTESIADISINGIGATKASQDEGDPAKLEEELFDKHQAQIRECIIVIEKNLGLTFPRKHLSEHDCRMNENGEFSAHLEFHLIPDSILEVIARKQQEGLV